MKFIHIKKGPQYTMKRYVSIPFIHIPRENHYPILSPSDSRNYIPCLRPSTGPARWHNHTWTVTPIIIYCPVVVVFFQHRGTAMNGRKRAGRMMEGEKGGREEKWERVYWHQEAMPYNRKLGGGDIRKDFSKILEKEIIWDQLSKNKWT